MCRLSRESRRRNRNCTNSHPKDRLSFGYCAPVIRVIVGGQLVGCESHDIQQRAAPRFGAAAVEHELYRETVALAQPAQYAVPIPLSLYISASGTRRYERDAWSVSPSNSRRAQFTLLSQGQ